MGKLINANQEELQQIIDSEKNIVLVDFWAEWCSPCRSLSPILKNISEETNATVVKVNVDDNSELSAKYNVKSIPVVFAIKNGEEVDKIVGAQSKNIYTELVKKHTETTDTKD